jgi:hypothetical protein
MATVKAPARWSHRLLLVAVPLAQQIGSVDLTRPQTQTVPAGNVEKTPLPNGCEKLSGGGIADGWVEPDNHRPHELLVEVIEVETTQLQANDEIEAVVQLKNADSHPIQVPWSTDPRAMDEGQDSSNIRWEAGTFELTLRNSEDIQMRLKSLTRSLYGSKFFAGSLLTLQPGQSITATVKFKLEDEYFGKPGEPNEGDWQLSAEWHQMGRSWRLNKCDAWNSYFQYTHFYAQKNPPVAIHINNRGAP